MTIRGLAGVLALLGGAGWLLASGLGESSGWWDELRWGALAAVLLSFACVGLNLVKGKSRWLDVVVGLAFPLLAWTVHEVLEDVVPDTRVLHGVLGATLVVVGGVLLRGGARGRDSRPDAPSKDSSRAPGHRAPSHRA